MKNRLLIAATALAAAAVLPLGGPTEADAVLGTSAPATAVQEDCGTVRLGDTGQAVVTVQYTLRSYGYTIAVDGVFGNQTDRAVRHFQRVSGLVEDGIAGPITRGAMHCGEGSSAPQDAPGSTNTAPTGLHALALSAGWPERLWPFVSCVIQRESGGNPQAYNGRGRDDSYGLMQLNTYGTLWSWYTARGLTSKSQLFDAYTNLRMGWLLYQQYPRAWGTCG